MPPTLWPAAHATALLPLIESGLSASKIADEINLMFNTDYSRNAVIGKVARLNKRCQGMRGGKTVATVPVRRRAAPPPPAAKPWRVPDVKRPRDITVGACQSIVPKGLSCVELEPSSCRWPYGEDPVTFCGHTRLIDRPYCGPHWELSRGEGTKSERMALK